MRSWKDGWGWAYLIPDHEGMNVKASRVRFPHPGHCREEGELNEDELIPIPAHLGPEFMSLPHPGSWEGGWGWGQWGQGQAPHGCRSDSSAGWGSPWNASAASAAKQTPLFSSITSNKNYIYCTVPWTKSFFSHNFRMDMYLCNLRT